MGILNRTPDSFYDGGSMDLGATVEHGLRMVEEGAEIIDIGAVKAGPGAPVSSAEEASRLLPVVAALVEQTDVLISIETSSPEVARRAVEAGASIINDVSALADPELADACAELGAALVLMHHGDQLRGRPLNPRYTDVVRAVLDGWEETALTAIERGVRSESLIVDPGLDFGKNTFHSLELMRRLPELMATGRPLLIAASRKDVVGESLGLPPAERLEGSLALAALAANSGAAMVRAHDVRGTVRVVRMVEAVNGLRTPVRPVRGLWD
ncbi:MAG: dihydropteroate synthase [Actinobacteria bacterium]|nr:dihydropteroate synthase [Actinomycetota bacterium]